MKRLFFAINWILINEQEAASVFTNQLSMESWTIDYPAIKTIIVRTNSASKIPSYVKMKLYVKIQKIFSYKSGWKKLLFEMTVLRRTNTIFLYIVKSYFFYLPLYVPFMDTDLERFPKCQTTVYRCIETFTRTEYWSFVCLIILCVYAIW